MNRYTNIRKMEVGDISNGPHPQPTCLETTEWHISGVGHYRVPWSLRHPDCHSSEWRIRHCSSREGIFAHIENPCSSIKTPLGPLIVNTASQPGVRQVMPRCDVVVLHTVLSGRGALLGDECGEWVCPTDSYEMLAHYCFTAEPTSTTLTQQSNIDEQYSIRLVFWPWCGGWRWLPATPELAVLSLTLVYRFEQNGQGWNFESCFNRRVSFDWSHHPEEVLLAQFSLYVTTHAFIITTLTTKIASGIQLTGWVDSEVLSSGLWQRNCRANSMAEI